MLRVMLGTVGTVAFVVLVPIFLGGAVLIGAIAAPFYYLDKAIGLHIMSEDTGLMDITPVSVQWADNGLKSVTVRVANRSGESWDRFGMMCRTDKGWAEPTDLSGIAVKETGLRTYVMQRSEDVNSVSSCELTSHMEGEPKPFNAMEEFQREGGGGWGDRLPVSGNGIRGGHAPAFDEPETSMSPVLSEDSYDPTVDKD